MPVQRSDFAEKQHNLALGSRSDRISPQRDEISVNGEQPHLVHKRPRQAPRSILHWPVARLFRSLPWFRTRLGLSGSRASSGLVLYFASWSGLVSA